MPQRVNYVNWSLGTLMGAGMNLSKHNTHTHTHTHVQMAAHVKWGNQKENEGSGKEGELFLGPFEQSTSSINCLCTTQICQMKAK